MVVHCIASPTVVAIIDPQVVTGESRGGGGDQSFLSFLCIVLYSNRMPHSISESAPD